MTADAEPKSSGAAASVPETYEIAVPDYLQKLLETIAKREGFSDGFKIISRSGSNVGDGFQGLMLSVVISGTRNGDSSDDLVLICKIPPMSELRRRMAVGAFKQEIAAYDQILPELVAFQQDKGVSEKDGFFAFPKCYGTHADEEKLEFAIVLEDLRHNGFRMWNKFAPIDYRHVQLALIELGKFHAISFALRRQQPDVFAKYQQYKSSMYKTIYDYPASTTFFTKNMDRAIQALHPEDNEERTKMEYLRDNFKSTFGYSVSANEAEPFSVLCHGDFWNNNMMFQYDTADSLEPKRVVIIDWQLSQYCSPATDLTYYLYSSTQQELRTNHFGDLLSVYHDSLREQLQRLGGNANEQFSFDDLRNQLNQFGIYGLILAPFLIQVVTVKPEDIPDMDSMTEENFEDFDFMGNGKLDAYNKRVREVARDFVGRGFFADKHVVYEKREGAEKKAE